MQTARKLLSLFTVTAMIFNFLTFFGVLSPVMAANLINVRSRLSDPTISTSSTHTFLFTVPTSSTVEAIRFQYSTTATNTTKPNGLNLANATLGTTQGVDATWTIDNTSAASGIVRVASGDGQDLGGLVVSLPIQAVINSAIDDCDGGSNTTSDTCFVQIQTASGADDAWDVNTVDRATVTYTVVAGVSVTATVDPTLTFVISAVGAGTTTTGAIATSVGSSVTTLPFGNLTAGTPRYVAHRLNVTTNANTGYTVSMRATTPMTGTYSSNNIDPFAGTGASWSDPQAWVEPTGNTPNTDTAWLGANTTDADISQFAAGEFGPVNGTNNTVMSSTTSDNGSSGIYVTYAIEANVYQPSDTYTGTIVYTATATY